MKTFFRFLPVVFFLTAIAAAGAATEELLGEGDDGNRTDAVHLLELLDEKGIQIKASDAKPEPFSTRQTCGKCHDYEKISSGRHFDSSKSAVPAGRNGQPFVLADLTTRTQIPVSNRLWKGAFSPEKLGITSWEYTKRFSSHIPGGDFSEIQPGENDPEGMIRSQISGPYQINCLTCHNADRRQDSSHAALQAYWQNYRWVATAACGIGTIKGAAFQLSDFFDPITDQGVTVTYDKNRFNSKNEVFFDIAGRPPVERCYFCHSTQYMAYAGDKEWTVDQDVHLAAGLSCVDCHRNASNHAISRGYETEAAEKNDPSLATLSCKGCHLGTEQSGRAEGGRLGAPVPEHPGIPTIHFEKLSCTACHSGPMPTAQAGLVRTARIHKLGLHGVHKADLKQPHVYAPVFIRGTDGKTAPHKLFWPSYWATMDDNDMKPLMPETVKKAAGDILSRPVQDLQTAPDWRPLSPEQIEEVLKSLAVWQPGRYVYISGGLMYSLNQDGKIISAEHDAAKPYSWPMAHDVRPAAQSLGAAGCGDCHELKSPFMFGTVNADSPVIGRSATIEMTSLQQLNPLYARLFAFSFVFRPWLKIFVIGSSVLIAAILVLYALKALGVVAEAAGKQS